jgi:hypothetical protein
MSHEVVIKGSAFHAKVRNPWGVIGLSLITFGIYSVFWWYYVNRELRDLGRARGNPQLGDNPLLSALTFSFLGTITLFIATVVSVVRGSKRVLVAQRMAGLDDVLNGWIAGLLWVFTFSLGWMAYTQSELNKVWQSETVAQPVVYAGVGAVALPARSGRDDLDRIEKLAQLRDSGALSEDEFQQEKAKLIGPQG